MKYKKPFSSGYVLRTTAKHMRINIDVSISKTFERINEFADDLAKSQEVFKTLATLHAMRKQLDTFLADYTDEAKA